MCTMKKFVSDGITSKPRPSSSRTALVRSSRVAFFTAACDAVSRNAATPPHFTMALMLPDECGRIRSMSSVGATA